MADGTFCRDLIPSVWSSATVLALRGLLWTILLPGVVTGYIPARFLGLSAGSFRCASFLCIAGLLFVSAGVLLLAACIAQFALIGRGTLSPLDPPRALVVRGLYAYVRNPMYLAVATILSGETLLLQSQEMVMYVIAFVFCATAFVLLYEEPALRSKFGESYEAYLRGVGRWIPRLHAWK